jgi:predicted ArsR family transcriptional regulator
MELLTMRDEWLIKKHAARLESLDFEERLQEVVNIYSENGFMSRWEKLPDGNYFIFQGHCAIHHLATQYRQLCVLEPRLMESLLGAKVTREKYILKDDPICGYVVHTADADAV